MRATQTATQNPLGLNIDFLFGRGFLWARGERLADWVVLESLRMEIPDLQFPFDARGGLGRFRHTRCLVREIELSISEAGLQELLARAASQLEGFEELRVRLIEGAAHISLKLRAFGADTHVSFRVALIPPEPPRADEIHLSIYDYRAFGPLPYPARLMAFELLKSLLNTPALRPPGRGESFTVGIAGDILSFRPLKLMLLYLFPRVGWKLPNLGGVDLEGARIRPGQLSVRATSSQGRWRQEPAEEAASRSFQISRTQEGSRAVAAYEAKDLFSNIDQVLFDGEVDRALEQLAGAREIYGAHPELISRALDCLLADPNPSHLAEAWALCQELLREDPEDLQALLAMPIIARLERRPRAEILSHYDALAERLRARQELDDWVLCELAAAQLVAEEDPAQATRRLRAILKLAPRNLEALERMRELAARAADWDTYEEVLKRLTGVYSERDSLKRTYLELAHHLMDRRGQATEARLYLERVLRLDPSDLDALDTLGQGYVLSEEPLRALRAFGSAARAARARGHIARAAALKVRVARLWRDELGNESEALLAARRALELLDLEEARGQDPDQGRAPGEGGARAHPLDRVEYLELAASLSEARERWGEALRWREELAHLLEELVEAPEPPEARADTPGSALGGLATLGELDGDEDDGGLSPGQALRRRLVDAQRALAMVYLQRDRPEAAAAHWRRVLELAPHDEQAASQLERHYRAAGRPEQLIAFYKELIERTEGRPERGVELRRKLARLYQTLQMTEEAIDQLREALRLAPRSALARQEAVELLRAAGRFETLRDLLGGLLVQVRDRQVRRELLLEQARLLVGELGQPRQAARAFFEALDLRPTDPEALEGARRALRAIVAAEGHDAPAPVGPDTTARLLERVLQRLVDLREDALERAQLLDELAALAGARGAEGAAREARRRARQLRERLAREQDAESGRAVDARLDELLGDPDAPRPGLGREPSGARSSGGFDRDALERKTRPKIKLPGQRLRQGGAGDAAADEALGSERPPRPGAQTVEAPAVDLGALAQGLGAPGRPPAEGGDEGGGAGDDDELLGDEFLESFRAKIDQVWKVSGSLEDASRQRGVSDLLSRSGAAAGGAERRLNKPTLEDMEPAQGPPSQAPRDLDSAPEPGARPGLGPLEEQIERARQADDPEDLARRLEALLERALAEGDPVELPEGRIVALSRELGELLYYDLEDAARAREHLERARQLDPQGAGAQISVLNALESIYEESGQLDRRIRLLEARLEGADTEDLATTYRLLIAQLHWDERQDLEAARAQLDAILERDGRHEAAHRLLAQIASEREQWSEAARHYEVMLSERSGGLDEVELERDLADLYLHRLERPARAHRHYEGVLEAAPADAQALEGIKQCQAMEQDWEGYLGSLGRELGLLIGQPEGVDLRDRQAVQVDRVPMVLRDAASQILSDAAHIAEQELGQPRQALDLWGAAFELWPEHVEALKRRIALGRELEDTEAVAEDLERWADLLLDARERFEALLESARLWRDELEDPERARQLLAQAIAVAAELDEPPEALAEARRELQRLQR